MNIMKKKAVVFSNLKNFSIVSTFFALWISTYFNVSSEDLLGYFLILSIGLLHGSNDLKIIIQTSNKLKGFGFFKLLSCYIFIVALVGISFYFRPALALFIFILIHGLDGLTLGTHTTGLCVYMSTLTLPSLQSTEVLELCLSGWTRYYVGFALDVHIVWY